MLERTTPLVWGWHIQAICDHAQALLEDWLARQRDPLFVQRMQNLLINCPPGIAKSRIVSVCAPAWMWLRCPSWRVICLSANPKVASRDSRYCRELITSEWYQETFKPEWELADDQNAKLLYYTTEGGYRAAAGITAKIVGERADALINDDPNDPKEVDSEVTRDSVNEGWQDATKNRVNDLRTSVRLGIQQRVHDQDWSGFILAGEREEWAHLCLPMEYEPQRYELEPSHKYHIPKFSPIGWCDPRTTPGEVLSPERFPEKVLASERRRARYYAGQYQQRPTESEGGMFKRAYWRFWRPEGVSAEERQPRPMGCYAGPARALPSTLRKIISVDATFKDGAKNDWVVLSVVGYTGAERYVLEVVRGHFGFRETCAKVRFLKARYPDVRKILIEDAANGPAIVDTLRSEIPGVIAVQPKGGKEARAAISQAACEAEQVYLKDGAHWVEELVEEHAAFPHGAHDDQVDSLSQACVYLHRSPGMQAAINMATM